MRVLCYGKLHSLINQNYYLHFLKREKMDVVRLTDLFSFLRRSILNVLFLFKKTLIVIFINNSLIYFLNQTRSLILLSKNKWVMDGRVLVENTYP